MVSPERCRCRWSRRRRQRRFPEFVTAFAWKAHHKAFAGLPWCPRVLPMKHSRRFACNCGTPQAKTGPGESAQVAERARLLSGVGTAACLGWRSELLDGPARSPSGDRTACG